MFQKAIYFKNSDCKKKKEKQIHVCKLQTCLAATFADTSRNKYLCSAKETFVLHDFPKNMGLKQPTHLIHVSLLLGKSRFTLF